MCYFTAHKHLALEPRHIAEDTSLIQIRQTINMVKGIVTVGQPKSRDNVPPNLRWCVLRLRNTDRSLSIENQLLVLNEYAAAMPEYLNAEILEFIDNGYSGTNFERPRFRS